jgi:hypothetical protein
MQATAIQCRRLLLNAGDCYSMQATAIKCRRLLLNAGDCY